MTEQVKKKVNGNVWKYVGLIGGVSVIFSAGIFTGSVVSHMARSDIHHTTSEKQEMMDSRIGLQLNGVVVQVSANKENITKMEQMFLRIEDKLDKIAEAK